MEYDWIGNIDDLQKTLKLQSLNSGNNAQENQCL